jgi:CMP-N,N'-diacetyllegionaminic acid synthase|tara:strand:+ start:179 stop:877 length:699 start_codon:yes stop_codon:yes gene_type:complete
MNIDLPKGCIVILARGGSKGIANKNMVDVFGHPLIYYVLSESLKFDKLDVFVSSDNKKILNFSKSLGAKTILRPEDISGDLSPDIEGFRHFFQKFENYDYAIHLRATFPLITDKIIDDANSIFLENYSEFDSLRSMIPSKQNPYKMWHVNGDCAETVIEGNTLHSMPRQVIEKTYIQNACIDITKRKSVLQLNSMTGNRCRPYLMDDSYNIDIDNKQDLQEAIDAIRFRNGE